MFRDCVPFVFAVYCGLFVVLVVRTVIGPFGMLRLTDLAEKEQGLIKNIHLLKEYQEILKVRVYKLENEMETQRLLARRMGYYRSNEKRIVIYGDTAIMRRLEVGSSFVWEETEGNGDIFAVWLLLLVSIFSYTFFVASGVRLGRVV